MRFRRIALGYALIGYAGAVLALILTFFIRQPGLKTTLFDGVVLVLSMGMWLLVPATLRSDTGSIAWRTFVSSVPSKLWIVGLVTGLFVIGFVALAEINLHGHAYGTPSISHGRYFFGAGEQRVEVTKARYYEIINDVIRSTEPFAAIFYWLGVCATLFSMNRSGEARSGRFVHPEVNQQFTGTSGISARRLRFRIWLAVLGLCVIGATILVNRF